MPITTSWDPNLHLGLDKISDVKELPEKIELDTSGLIQYNTPFTSNLDVLFQGMKIDHFLFESIKPDATLTTQNGKVYFTEALATILNRIPALKKKQLLTNDQAESLSRAVRDDIFNHELLSAFRRTFIGT